MRLETALRLSFYAALASACLTLGYAATYFLPWMPFFVLAIGFLMGLAYAAEGRWTLDAVRANLLGVLIAFGSACWVIYTLPRTDDDWLSTGVPWPSSLLPQAAPVLMMLMLVKLVRPKHNVDFWVLHMIGLIMVTLSCVLAGEATFGIFLVLYMACLVWSLGTLVRYRGVLEEHWPRRGGWAALWLAARSPGSAGPASATSALAVPVLSATVGQLGGLRPVARRTAGVVALGLLLFLFTPRPGTTLWNPQRLSAGASRVIPSPLADVALIDLYRTGTVTLGEEVAFNVQVRDRQGAKTDLRADQRWRGETLDIYAKGFWQDWKPAFERGGARPPLIRYRSDKPLPDLGPEQLSCTFAVELAKAGTLVLADQFPLDPELGRHPYENVAGFGSFPLFYEIVGSGTLTPRSRDELRRRIYRYLQVLVSQPGNRTPAVHVTDAYADALLRQQVPEGIGEFTRKLLARLPLEAGEFLSGEAVAGQAVAGHAGSISKRFHAQVAQGLSDHLASSGEYTYSLNLRRQDQSLDPAMDFLTNVKEGHCDRYAGALALMLRGVGIPARVVRGFRGAEHLGDGDYQVRQNEAHSWVEALVPNDDDAQRQDWLTLDPTPGLESAVGAGLFSRFGQFLASIPAIWRNLVLHYDTEHQRQAMDALWQALKDQTTPTGLVRIGVWLSVGLGTLIVVSWLRKRWRGGRAAASSRPRLPVVRFYAQLLAVLARRCRLTPGVTQTPLEFAGTAQHELRRRALPAALAGLPTQVVDLLYRLRYGGMTVDDATHLQIESAIGRLDAALKPT